MTQNDLYKMLLRKSLTVYVAVGIFILLVLLSSCGSGGFFRQKYTHLSFGREKNVPNNPEENGGPDGAPEDYSAGPTPEPCIAVTRSGTGDLHLSEPEALLHPPGREDKTGAGLPVSRYIPAARSVKRFAFPVLSEPGIHGDTLSKQAVISQAIYDGLPVFLTYQTATFYVRDPAVTSDAICGEMVRVGSAPDTACLKIRLRPGGYCQIGENCIDLDKTATVVRTGQGKSDVLFLEQEQVKKHVNEATFFGVMAFLMFLLAALCFLASFSLPWVFFYFIPFGLGFSLAAFVFLIAMLVALSQV